MSTEWSIIDVKIGVIMPLIKRISHNRDIANENLVIIEKYMAFICNKIHNTVHTCKIY